MNGIVAVIHTIEDWLGLFFGIMLVITFGAGIYTVAQLVWSKQTWMKRAGWVAAGWMWILLDVPYGALPISVLRSWLWACGTDRSGSGTSVCCHPRVI